MTRTALASDGAVRLYGEFGALATIRHLASDRAILWQDEAARHFDSECHIAML